MKKTESKYSGAICGDGMCPYVPCKDYPDCIHEKKFLREIFADEKIEMAMDYRQREKVNVFSNIRGCRLEVVIAKDGRRRTIWLTIDEIQLLMDKLKKQLRIRKECSDLKF